MSHAEPTQLVDYAAGRLGERQRARVAQHLGGCEACRRSLARLGAARAALQTAAELPVPPLSPGREARMEAAMRWTRTGQMRLVGWFERERRRLVFALGVVSMMATAAMGVVWWHAQRPASLVTEAPTALARALTPSPSRQVEPRPLYGVVTLLGGTARVARGGGETELGPQTMLAAGDRLVVADGARAGFQWGEGSGALLGGSGALVLERLDTEGQALRLEQGRLVVRLGPHETDGSLGVSTPERRFTVHSTWFVVGASELGTTLEVLEGAIEVEGAAEIERTRVLAPVRMVFSRGPHGETVTRALPASEAAALRATSELPLLPWIQSAGAEVDWPSIVARSGWVDIQPEPPAQVAVDGVSFGGSPLRLRRAEGRHLVELGRPGFSTLHQWVSFGPEPVELRTALPRLPSKAKAMEAPSPVAELKRLVESRRRAISACYDRALKRDPSLEGAVTLRIQVGASGKVRATAVESDTLGDAAVVDCLRREAARWTFAHSRNVTLVYPFVFRTP